MDITKFYELRKRLYSAAASGTAAVWHLKILMYRLLAADIIMLDSSRKFTDELILQFQNKPKGAQK